MALSLCFITVVLAASMLLRGRDSVYSLWCSGSIAGFQSADPGSIPGGDLILNYKNEIELNIYMACS